MMSIHGENSIFFNKRNKGWTSRALVIPTPKCPITSHFYLFPSTFPILLKVDAICVSPQKWFENLLSDREQGIYFNKKATKTLEMKCGAPQESILGSIRQCFY